MRVLLDENFPIDFAPLLVGHQVATVHSMGWSGMKNGELLRRAANVCEVFITLDRNLVFQQNIRALSFSVVVVHAVSNRMADLVSHVESILLAIGQAAPGTIEKAGTPE